jgi:hypothetical protein
MQSVYDQSEGIAYIKYDGKPQTLMNIKQKVFSKQFELDK